MGTQILISSKGRPPCRPLPRGRCVDPSREPHVSTPPERLAPRPSSRPCPYLRPYAPLALSGGLGWPISAIISLGRSGAAAARLRAKPAHRANQERSDKVRRDETSFPGADCRGRTP